MALTVFTAVTGAWEAPLVGALESGHTGVAVVRRCVDLADLLSAASTGQAQAVLLSADLRRLDREALALLGSAGLAVVGLYPPAEPDQARRLQALGVGHVLPADAPAADISAAVEEAVRERGDRAGSVLTAHVLADPAVALAPAFAAEPATSDALDGAGPAPGPERPGRVVAVWGPAGAPGRTTVAINLATELAALGEPTLLADADTYASSIAQTLGVLDEAPGLAAACRAAGAGTLDAALLARLAPALGPRLRVLTGITRAARWPEIGGAALAGVWQVARQVAAWTVVDCGFCLERDEELSYDTAAPRRNAASLVTLEDADVVIAVGAGDPVGLQRLVRGLAELAEVVPTAAPTVVVTRVRASAVGSGPQRRIAEALGRYAGVHDVLVVPDDRSSLDAALLAGRTLTESAHGSPARRALADLATRVAGRTPATRPGGRSPRHGRMGA